MKWGENKKQKKKESVKCKLNRKKKLDNGTLPVWFQKKKKKSERRKNQFKKKAND